MTSQADAGRPRAAEPGQYPRARAAGEARVRLASCCHHPPLPSAFLFTRGLPHYSSHIVARVSGADRSLAHGMRVEQQGRRRGRPLISQHWTNIGQTILVAL